MRLAPRSMTLNDLGLLQVQIFWNLALLGIFGSYQWLNKWR